MKTLKEITGAFLPSELISKIYLYGKIDLGTSYPNLGIQYVDEGLKPADFVDNGIFAEGEPVYLGDELNLRAR